MPDSQGANGSIVSRSLNGVAVTGAGSITEYGYVRNNHSMQVVFSGAPTTMTVNLQLSLDGVTWFTAAASVIQSDTTGKIVTAVDTPAKFSRANVTILTGGAPVITAFVAGV